jgi:multicomponent Na+:H+ antiporter subunit D
VQLLFITGFGLKGALIPFHAWLPDAHSSAPSPISAMLSGVLIKAIGIYCMIRIFFNMFILTEDFAVILTTLGALSMVLGALIAMVQNDMKRMFAYSSISQVGYIITGIGMGMIILARKGDQGIAALAIGGGLFHMINHAVFKGLLFLNAGAVEYENRTRNLDELGDLSTVMPVTYGTSLTASLSVSGIPPFNGFFSKLIIIIAAIQGHFYLLAALAVVVSIITLGYFMKFQKQAFFNVSRFFNKLKIKEVPFTMCFSMIVLAILCLVLSLLVFPGPRDLILTPAVEAVMNVKEYSTIITGI